MKKIAFTICSNNYLSQALVVKETFLVHHPHYEFYIGLVDDLVGIKGVFPDLKDIIPVNDIGISEFNDMSNRYNITELNTSVKPFYFEYFFTKLKSEWVIYIDPDICVYNKFEEVEDFLSNGTEVVLTPHILSPIGNWDICYIREGIFNLGFVAFSNQPTVIEFLVWWKSKLINQGYFSYSKNLFYDQLWMNLSISFLRHVSVLYHPGYNVAGWNLFERKLIYSDSNVYINDINSKLVFFHFSGVSFSDVDLFISIHFPNVTINDRPDLRDLLFSYRLKVNANNYEKVKLITPKFTKLKRSSTLSEKFKIKAIRIANLIFKTNIE